MLSPGEILEKTIETGVAKVNKSFVEKMVLGFLGGALIAFGCLALIKSFASFTGELAGFGTIIAGLLFPIGLIIIILGGGELATGNMMVVGASMLAKRVSVGAYFKNVFTIIFWNFFGALFMAVCLAKLAGVADPETVIRVAQGKVDGPFYMLFFSAIGCNWLVAAAVWMSTGAKDGVSKAVLIYFPIAIFIILGFQHSVANFFFMTAGIVFNGTTWGDLLYNAVPVILGNFVGGLVFVAVAYFYGFNGKSLVKK